MATTTKTTASTAAAAPAAKDTITASRAYMEVVSMDEETGEVTDRNQQ